MKKLILLIFTALSISVNAQNLTQLPMKDGRVYYEKVFQADSVSKNDLYLRAKNTFLRNFRSTKDVIQFDDKENGIVTGKAYSFFNTKGGILNIENSVKFRFTMSIYAKEGKYKIDIYDIYLIPPLVNMQENPIETNYNVMLKKGKKSWSKTYQDFDTKMNAIVYMMSTEMSKKLNTDF